MITLVFHDATCSFCDRCDCLFCFDTLERYPRNVVCFLARKHDCHSSHPAWNQIKTRHSDPSTEDREHMNMKKRRRVCSDSHEMQNHFSSSSYHFPLRKILVHSFPLSYLTTTRSLMKSAGLLKGETLKKDCRTQAIIAKSSAKATSIIGIFHPFISSGRCFFIKINILYHYLIFILKYHNPIILCLPHWYLIGQVWLYFHIFPLYIKEKNQFNTEINLPILKH